MRDYNSKGVAPALQLFLNMRNWKHSKKFEQIIVKKFKIVIPLKIVRMMYYMPRCGSSEGWIIAYTKIKIFNKILKNLEKIFWKTISTELSLFKNIKMRYYMYMSSHETF